MFAFLTPFSCPPLRSARGRKETVGSWLSVTSPAPRSRPTLRPSKCNATSDKDTPSLSSTSAGPSRSSPNPVHAVATPEDSPTLSASTPLQGKKEMPSPDDKHKQVSSATFPLDRLPEAKPVFKGSRYASCLAPASSKRHPNQKAQKNVEQDLLDDMKRFSRKYEVATLPAPSKVKGPATRTSLYSIPLPQGEVHNKFCSPKKSEANNATKFSIATLRKWFNKLDVGSTGTISKREMILALRANKGLQSLFLQENPAEALREDNTIEGRKTELQNILKIMREVDTDRSGSLEWGELLDFFRRCGLLLEYSAHTDLNNPALDHVATDFSDHVATAMAQKNADEANEEQHVEDEKQETPLPPGMIADASVPGGVSVVFKGTRKKPTGHPLMVDLGKGKPISPLNEALTTLKGPGSLQKYLH